MASRTGVGGWEDEGEEKGICWVTGETNIWDGHCPSSLPKPQTLWQQENQSGSDQGLCNPDPGRASAGGGSGGLGSGTEPTSEVRLDPLVCCRRVPALGFKASKIHFLVQNLPRAGTGSLALAAGLRCPAVRGAGPLAVCCGCGGGQWAWRGRHFVQPSKAPHSKMCNSRSSRGSEGSPANP